MVQDALLQLDDCGEMMKVWIYYVAEAILRSLEYERQFSKPIMFLKVTYLLEDPPALQPQVAHPDHQSTTHSRLVALYYLFRQDPSSLASPFPSYFESWAIVPKVQVDSKLSTGSRMARQIDALRLESETLLAGVVVVVRRAHGE